MSVESRLNFLEKEIARLKLAMKPSQRRRYDVMSTKETPEQRAERFTELGKRAFYNRKRRINK